jgi:hypothetical protein
MFTICNLGISPSRSLIPRAGVVVCALLAAACHSGLDNPAAPGPPPGAEALSATSGDEVSSLEALSTDSTRRMTMAIAEVSLSGHSGECTLAAARGGFRLKAQGLGTAGTTIRFHLIRADGFRTTAIVDVSRQGTFRTGQELVTYFPPSAEVRCVLLSMDGAVLAESATFNTP